MVEDILRKGQEQAQDIVRQGEAERDEQMGAAEGEIQESREKSLKKIEGQIAQLEQHELSSAELESRKILLAAQRDVLEDLKERSLAELAAYPSEKKQALYAKLFAKAKGILGDCNVYSNEADRSVLRPPSGITSVGTIDCAGGLVFESKDRSVRLDYRFETMLEEVWSQKMNEIYTQLFG